MAITDLQPGDVGGFDRWFPIRFYRFTEGVFITAAPREHAGLIGKRVLRIGRLSADSAAQLAGSLPGRACPSR